MAAMRRMSCLWALVIGCAAVGQAEPRQEGAAPAPSTPSAAATGAAKPVVAPAAETSKPFLLTAQEPDRTAAAAPGDFAVAVLPDTQFYTAVMRGGEAAMFTAQADWIVSNRVSRNIVFVVTEGDISNDGGKVTVQWQRATNALYRLEDPARTGLPDGIPYAAVVGNHDTYYGGTAKFNAYFGPDHFAGRPYYGGHYGTNNDSHYDFFRAGGQDYIVLSLTYAAGTDRDLMRWANGVLHAHAARRAIVVTHSLLNPAPWPKPASWTQEGPAIFAPLTNNANLFLMLCGHRHGEGRRHEAVGNGRWLDVVLADYQDYRNGGDGFMRLMEFSPGRQAIRVKTFSPWTGQWATNSDSCFTLVWPQAAGK